MPGPVRETSYWVYHVAFSPDGRMLVTAGGSTDNHTELIAWDAASGDRWFALTGHRAAVHTVAFAAGGSVLASAGHDDTVSPGSAVRCQRAGGSVGTTGV
jgi:WD40 repeat protein